jgi:hypothetical protein
MFLCLFEVGFVMNQYVCGGKSDLPDKVCKSHILNFNQICPTV